MAHHFSDIGGVVTGIDDRETTTEKYKQLAVERRLGVLLQQSAEEFKFLVGVMIKIYGKYDLLVIFVEKFKNLKKMRFVLL